LVHLTFRIFADNLALRRGSHDTGLPAHRFLIKR
jgi:hypothetical protein